MVRGRRSYEDSANLLHDYQAGVVNNGDEVWYCGEAAEVLGMFHRGEDDHMYIGLLLIESGIRTQVVVD